ncbi:unnamed protein product [Camellia sinensis]
MDDCSYAIIQNAWAVPTVGSNQFLAKQQLNRVMKHLRNWSSLSNRSLQGQIVETRAELSKVQAQLKTNSVAEQDWSFGKKLDGLLQKQEVYWEQRSMQRWMAVGIETLFFFFPSNRFMETVLQHSIFAIGGWYFGD